MRSLNSIFDKSHDIDIVKLKEGGDERRFRDFIKARCPGKYAETHPVDFGSRCGLLGYDGSSPFQSGKWLGFCVSHLLEHGARIWGLDEFIAEYDRKTAEEKRRERIQRGLDRYFAAKDLCIEGFLSDLQSLFGGILFHVPHASTKLPESFFDGCLLPEMGSHAQGGRVELRRINLKMSDVLLLDLIEDLPYPKITPDYSRLYVDVEKYWDAAKEPMAKYGLGAVYEKDFLGRRIREADAAYLAKAKEYYEAHHKRLFEAVKGIEGDVLLIDLHSFGEDMANIASKGPYPDICIGYNEGHDEWLVGLFERYCDAKGLSHRRNFPYSGSMAVPAIEGKKVRSIMIEVNKRVYL